MTEACQFIIVRGGSRASVCELVRVEGGIPEYRHFRTYDEEPARKAKSSLETMGQAAWFVSDQLKKLSTRLRRRVTPLEKARRLAQRKMRHGLENLGVLKGKDFLAG